MGRRGPTPGCTYILRVSAACLRPLRHAIFDPDRPRLGGHVRRAGIDVEMFMRVLRQSALYAPTFDKKLPRMLSRDFTSPNFPVEHMLKDVRLVRAEGQRLGLASETLGAIETILERAIALGHARSDYSALYEGVDLRPDSPAPDDPA